MTPIAVEIIGKPGATDERPLAIDQQEFAVIAQEVSGSFVPAGRVIETQLHPARMETLPVLGIQAEGTEAIEQHRDPHAARRR